MPLTDRKVKREHKAKKVAIKTAEIDIHIIPLIQWMNEFSGIFTRWSCEGTPNNTITVTKLSELDDVFQDFGYISFYAEDQHVVSTLIFELQAKADEIDIPHPEVTVDVAPGFGYLRFAIRTSRKHLIALAKTCTK